MIERIQKIINDKKGLIISLIYKNVSSKIKIQCSVGHEWETKIHNILYGDSWCPKCSKIASANKKRLNIDIIKIIANRKGGECLSNNYLNNRTKLDFKCASGHTWKAIADTIINRNSWCPKCSNKEKMNIQIMNDLARNRKGKCLSLEYINNSTKLLWECNSKHQWFATPSMIKNDNNWCPFCKESKGENAIFNSLIDLNILYERQKSFDECRSIYGRKLFFDFYLPDYNLLIEYDGRQHYEVVRFNGVIYEKAYKKYLLQKQNDKIKNSFCNKKGIKLIRISYKQQEKVNILLESLVSN